MSNHVINEIQQKFQVARDKFINIGAIHIVMGSFLTKFVSFFGSIFLVRFLSKEEYGILSYFENFSSYFMLLAGFGLASGLQRYMVLAETQENKKYCYTRAVKQGSLYNAVLLFVCLFLYINYPHPENFAAYLQIGIILILTIPFVYLVNVNLFALRALFDSKKYAYLAFLTSTFLIVARIIGASVAGLKGTTGLRLIAEIGCALLCSVFVYRRHFKDVQTQKTSKVFNKEMNIYSFQIMLTDGLWAIFMLNDLFILGQLSGNETVIADYKVAYVIPANLSILTAAIGVFVAPYFTKHERDMKWVGQNFKRVLMLTIGIMGGACALCFVLAKPLILLLYGNNYLSAVPIMRLLLIASFMNNGIRASIANILSAMGIQKLNLYIAMLGILIQISLDLILVPRLQGAGIAISSSITYSFMSLLLFVFFLKKYGRAIKA